MFTNYCWQWPLSGFICTIFFSLGHMIVNTQFIAWYLIYRRAIHSQDTKTHLKILKIQKPTMKYPSESSLHQRRSRAGRRRSVLLWQLSKTEARKESIDQKISRSPRLGVEGSSLKQQEAWRGQAPPSSWIRSCRRKRPYFQRYHSYHDANYCHTGSEFLIIHIHTALKHTIFPPDKGGLHPDPPTDPPGGLQLTHCDGPCQQVNLFLFPTGE